MTMAKAREDWDKRAETVEKAMSFILDRYDGSIAAFYESGRKHVDDMMLALSFALKGQVPEDLGTVLEIGCGIGRMTWHLSPYCDKLVAMDISPNMIELAKKHCPVPERVKFVAASSLIDPAIWGNGKYDLVVSHLVFQHMPYATAIQFMDQACDVLHTGGILHIQMDYGQPIPNIPDNDTIWVRPWDINRTTNYISGRAKGHWQALNMYAKVEGQSEDFRWLTLRKVKQD